MASLNDIESQLDTIINDLSGGISSSTIFDVIVDEGAYTLINDKTFDDITAELTAGKMPIIRWATEDTTYFFTPSITATSDTPTMSWYMLRAIISDGNIQCRITLLLENVETSNKFTTMTFTISD